jgi:hypothetical protein
MALRLCDRCNVGYLKVLATALNKSKRKEKGFSFLLDLL